MAKKQPDSKEAVLVWLDARDAARVTEWKTRVRIPGMATALRKLAMERLEQLEKRR